MDINNQKRTTRNLIRTRLQQLNPEEIKNQCIRGNTRFIESDLYKNADEILLYKSTELEFSVNLIGEQSLKDNKKIAFPTVINSENSEMEFFWVDSLDEKFFKVGKWGIIEPKTDLVKVNVSELRNAVVLVPGVAFDFCGNRLGHGKGFYDKYLNSAEQILSDKKLILVGAAFDVQYIPKIPANNFDIKMDYILTGNLLNKFSKQDQL